MQFIHKATRLSCDLNRGFRFFTRAEMVEKWSDYILALELKPGGSYCLTNKSGASPVVDARIVSYERERHLTLAWKDNVFPDSSYELALKFMPCRSDTDYCTEVHLMFCAEGRPLDEAETGHYGRFFENLLESLRLYQNKDWVIQDSDLSLSWLRGSGL